MSILSMIGSPAATRALGQVARDEAQSPDLRLAAIGVLLAKGDLSVLPQAQRFLTSHDPRVSDTAKGLAASAMGYGVRDPKAVPFLAPLLSSSLVQVRRGAAAALRNTRAAAAIKPLAGALYDSDREVRYLAVEGLGEITGQDQWTPSEPYFIKNEKRFLQHWRDWVRAQGIGTPPK